MKTITFFSEKGGVGKSSFSILYASWLHHKHGVKVAMADFNDRISDYRAAEVRERNRIIRENPGKYLPYDGSKTWPIFNADFQKIDALRRRGSVFPYATWFEDTFVRNAGNAYDVVVCDFPGSLTGGEFENLLATNMLNYIVIPIEKEEQTIQSTMKLNNSLKGINHSVFINKALLDLRNIRTQYMNFGKLLASKGLPMLPDMVSRSDKMQVIEKVDIIRSTFNYPDFDSEAFARSRDLGIENLFLDVTRELAKTRDLYGTGKADLSFTERLAKRQDGRSFTGSSYPEYENR